jgi:hypothetical protein
MDERTWRVMVLVALWLNAAGTISIGLVMQSQPRRVVDAFADRMQQVSAEAAADYEAKLKQVEKEMAER